MLEFGHELTITIANCKAAQFRKTVIHNDWLSRARPERVEEPQRSRTSA